jgi:hypothetical protein
VPPFIVNTPAPSIQTPESLLSLTTVPVSSTSFPPVSTLNDTFLNVMFFSVRVTPAPTVSDTNGEEVLPVIVLPPPSIVTEWGLFAFAVPAVSVTLL